MEIPFLTERLIVNQEKLSEGTIDSRDLATPQGCTAAITDRSPLLAAGECKFGATLLLTVCLLVQNGRSAYWIVRNGLSVTGNLEEKFGAMKY